VDERLVTLGEFEADTKLHVRHPYDGTDLAYQSYGQVLFFNSARADIRDVFPEASLPIALRQE